MLTTFLQDPESQIKVSGDTFFVDSIDSHTVIDNLLHFEGHGKNSGRNSIFLKRVAPDDDLNDLEEILNHHNLLDIVSSSRWDDQHHHNGEEEINSRSRNDTIKQSYRAIKQSISVPRSE